MITTTQHHGPIWPGITRPALTREPILVWAHTGTASVRIDGVDHEVAAEEALWVPAGVKYQIRTKPDSIIFPIPYPATACPVESIADPTRTPVPPEWENRLIFEFLQTLGHLKTTNPHPSLLASMAKPASAAGPVPRRPSLTMPRSDEAFQVACRIRHDPGQQRGLDHFAKEVGISQRTLQRRFAAETGLSFTAWCARAKILAAVDHLQNGKSISWVSHHVGFAGASAFTRAFRSHVGCSPARYQQALMAQNGQSVAGTRWAPARQSPSFADSPPGIPSATTGTRVNTSHIAVWMYRGHAQVNIAGEHHELGAGDAMMIPAGIPHSVLVAADSLMLPVGYRPVHGEPVKPSSNPVTLGSHYTPGQILHHMVSTYTTLRPAAFRSGALFEHIAAQTLHSEGSVANDHRPVSAVLTMLMSNGSGDDRPLAAWADVIGSDPKALHNAFHHETRVTFQRWRLLIRMTEAIDELELGIPAANVARGLGYANLPAFSRAFRTAHGVSPQQYVRCYSSRALATDWRKPFLKLA